MKFTICFLTFIFCTAIHICCTAQDVEIIERSDFNPELNVTRFDLIDDKFDLTGFQVIAKISGTTTHHKKNNLFTLFHKMWKVSNSLGANAFKPDTIYFDESKHTVVLNVYLLNKEELIYNRTLYPTNTHYFLSEIRSNNFKPQHLNIYSEEITLNFLEYASCKLEIDQDVKVKAGKNLKSSLRLKWEEGKLPVFYFFTKEGIGAGALLGQVTYNSPGAYPIELNEGMFLILNMVKKREGIRQ